MEAEHDLEVAELFEALDGLFGESGVVDADDGFGAAPVVVGGFAASADDVRDRDHFVGFVGHETPAATPSLTPADGVID